MKRNYLISKLNTIAILLESENPLFARWCKQVVNALIIENSIPTVLQKRKVSIIPHVGLITNDYKEWCERTTHYEHPLYKNVNAMSDIKPVQTYIRKHPELV